NDVSCLTRTRRLARARSRAARGPGSFRRVDRVHDVAAGPAHPRQRDGAPGRVFQPVAAGVGGARALVFAVTSLRRQHLLSRAAHPDVLGRHARRRRYRRAADLDWSEAGSRAQPDDARCNRGVRTWHIHAGPVSDRQPRRGAAGGGHLRLRSIPARTHHAHGASVEHVDAVGVPCASPDARHGPLPWRHPLWPHARPGAEVVTYSARRSNYLVATPSNWLYGRTFARRGGPERRLFPGALAVLLAMIGLLLRIPSRRQIVYLIAMVAAFEMSLGFGGYAYTFLHGHVSVYRGLRAPARLGIFVVMFLGVLAAYGYDAIAS